MEVLSVVMANVGRFVQLQLFHELIKFVRKFVSDRDEFMNAWIFRCTPHVDFLAEVILGTISITFANFASFIANVIQVKTRVLLEFLQPIDPVYQTLLYEPLDIFCSTNVQHRAFLQIEYHIPEFRILHVFLEQCNEAMYMWQVAAFLQVFVPPICMKHSF